MSTRKNSVRPLLERIELLLERLVVGKQFERSRESGRLISVRRGNRVERRKAVDRPPGVGRDLVVVRARLSVGRHALAARAVEVDAIEVALGRVVGRGDEVDPVRLVVDREKLRSRRNRRA